MFSQEENLNLRKRVIKEKHKLSFKKEKCDMKCSGRERKREREKRKYR